MKYFSLWTNYTSTAHDKCDCCLVLYVGTLPFTVQTVYLGVYFLLRVSYFQRMCYALCKILFSSQSYKKHISRRAVKTNTDSHAHTLTTSHNKSLSTDFPWIQETCTTTDFISALFPHSYPHTCCLSLVLELLQFLYRARAHKNGRLE